MPDSAPQQPSPAQFAGSRSPADLPAAAPARRTGPLGKVLIGLSGVAWLLAVAAVVITLAAYLAGELEGMAALSGIVIIAFAVGGALLMTGVTLLYLYLSRRRRAARPA